MRFFRMLLRNHRFPWQSSIKTGTFVILTTVSPEFLVTIWGISHPADSGSYLPSPILNTGNKAIDLWKSDIAAFSEQGTIPREFTVRCKDGTSKVIIFRVMLLSNNEKCIICEDITERRESEKVRKLLSCIVESSNDAIIGKKIDGTIISWNHAAEDMYGYSLQEIIGKNISLIVPYERREELENILKQISRGEGVSNLETERVKKDGSRIDVSVTISPIIDDTGAVIGASTISHDISSRKSEELYRESEDKYRLWLILFIVGVYRSTGDSKGRFIGATHHL